MALELHRRDDAADAEIKLVKVFPRWTTEDALQEIPLTEAEAFSRVLIDALPAETLAELSRLLAAHVARG